jgi:hypothetical protein
VNPFAPKPQSPAPAPAPKPPATTRRVVASTVLGTSALGSATYLAFEHLPAHVGGTALTWAIVGSAMRGGIKLARFTQSRKWEGRVGDMRSGLASKASFERSLNELERLGGERLAAGADPAGHAAFQAAVDRLRTHDPLARTMPGLRRRQLAKQIDALDEAGRKLGLDPARSRELVAKMKGGVQDRVRFDRNLALHARFAKRVQRGTRARGRIVRAFTGIDDKKASELKGTLVDMDHALELLKDKDPGNDPDAMQQLLDAVQGLNIAPRMRSATSKVRWVIDGVQFSTYAVSLGALAHAVASFPHEWPAAVVSGIFAFSSVADGVKIAAVRLGSFFEPEDRASVSSHRFFEKTLPSVDEVSTKYGGLGTLVKAVATGDGWDGAASLLYLYGAHRQRADSVGRDYRDPDPADTVARKKMLNAKTIAAAAALGLAGDAAAHQIIASLTDDDEKKKHPPATPTPGPTPTPGASATPTPTATASPGPTGASPTPAPSSPAPGPTSPPPRQRPPLVVVDPNDPRAATLWAIAHAHEDSLLTQAEVASARARGGPEAETAQALRQLFQLNPQRGFRPELMDGVASSVPGDPDSLRPGWRIDVDNPAVP